MGNSLFSGFRVSRIIPFYGGERMFVNGTDGRLFFLRDAFIRRYFCVFYRPANRRVGAGRVHQDVDEVVVP